MKQGSSYDSHKNRAVIMPRAVIPRAWASNHTRPSASRSSITVCARAFSHLRFNRNIEIDDLLADGLVWLDAQGPEKEYWSPQNLLQDSGWMWLEG
jgi:hypothetical protein